MNQVFRRHLSLKISTAQADYGCGHLEDVSVKAPGRQASRGLMRDRNEPREKEVCRSLTKGRLLDALGDVAPCACSRHSEKMAKNSGLGLFWPVLVLLLAAIITIPLKLGQHVFEPKVLQQIAKDAIARGGSNTTAVVQGVIAGLKEKYPGHVMDNDEWVRLHS
jgi:hypothetical protein